jgi:LysR family pca operon transcriptional activator
MAATLDPRIKLRHLSAFLETVRQGGVARAGSELGMTQPAVSKAIADLEAILDVALFDRSRRALSLTAHGEMFERFAQSGLATLRQGLETIEEARSGTKFIAFGALPTVAAGVVPRALQRFSKSSFACRALVESGPSPYLLGLLRTSAIDFVVGRMAQPAALDGLSFEHLYSDELALAVRPGHPLTASASLTLRDLMEFQLLMPPRQAIIRTAVDTLLITGGLGRPVNEIETVSNSLGRSYTLLSDAVWIISHGVVERDIAAGHLVRLDIDVSGTQGAVGVTTRSGAELSLSSRAMLDCIRQSVAPPPAE